MADTGLRTIGAVAVGGAVGAAMRWGVGTQLDIGDVGSYPWHTFAVNVVGCLLIGVAAQRLDRDSVEWAFVVTGVLGGFTTMSAVAVELNDYADAGRSGIAVAYVVATLGVGLVAVLIGERIGQRERSGGQPR